MGLTNPGRALGRFSLLSISLNDAADELKRRGALFAPSAIPCSLSLLISRIYSCLISDWRRTVSSKFFDTQVPSIFTEKLVLPRHARCVFSRLRCNGQSLLLDSYLSRIGRIENPSWSACGHSSQDTSHLILHCPAMDSLRRSLFGDSLSIYNLWSRPLGVARLLGFHGLLPCRHPSEEVGQQQQQQTKKCIDACLCLSCNDRVKNQGFIDLLLRRDRSFVANDLASGNALPLCSDDGGVLNKPMKSCSSLLGFCLVAPGNLVFRFIMVGNRLLPLNNVTNRMYA